MWGSPAHPEKDFIGYRRSAATGCFTSSRLRFLAKIHDCLLQECGQAMRIVHAWMLLEGMLVWTAKLSNKLSIYCIRVLIICVSTLVQVDCECPRTLKTGLRADAWGWLSGSRERQSACLVKSTNLWGGRDEPALGKNIGLSSFITARDLCSTLFPTVTRKTRGEERRGRGWWYSITALYDDHI